MSRKRSVRRRVYVGDGMPPEAAPDLFTCGIYVIACTPSRRFYIGSSIKVERRLREHMRELARGKHHCPALQLAFNKYGSEAFRAYVVEYAEPDERLVREQAWLDAWFSAQPRRLLNGSPVATRPPKFQEWSSEVRARVSRGQSERTRMMHRDDEFAKRHRGRLIALNSDPVFAEANRARSSARMRRLNQDPDFRRRLLERVSEQGSRVMSMLHQNEAFRARHLARLDRINADPASRARCVAATQAANSKRCRVTWSDGEQVIYRSAKQASIETGVKQSTITNRCRSGAKGIDGSLWEFV